MSLMVTISGVRGIVGESLTPEVVVRYTSAFAEYCRAGKVVVGRDGRVSGKIISNLVTSTLLAAGCDVVYLGIAPTPTIGIAVEQLHAEGGISITASHNPIEWNGLKFIGKSGMFLNRNENRKLWTLADASGRRYAPWNRLGRYMIDDSFLRQHIDMVMNLSYIDVPKIRERRLRVAVDCVNASGSVIVPALLRELGCEVLELNCDGRGVFPRPPEPVPENLGAFCSFVRQHQADLGVVVDPDADRLVLVTEEGKPYGEEYTIATVVKYVLEKSKRKKKDLSPVVINLSTTRAVDDIAAACGVKVVRTPVGEINVATRMKELRSIVGGEGSGGVIVPATHYGRDAIVGIGIILQSLVDDGGTLSGLRSRLPRYEIVKTKIPVDGRETEKIFSRLRKQFGKKGTINAEDGLKIDFENSWVHLRASNTEPIIRIIAEAPTAAEADTLVRTVAAGIGAK
ncbi:MAG TPA: phosphoglucosamine mutase [Bacteroidota bacterium]|nr:phosphoglucosamine mutase [Bacteroidota bacterium]